MRVLRYREENIIVDIGSSTEITEPVEGSYIVIDAILKSGTGAIIRVYDKWGEVTEFYIDGDMTRATKYIQMPETLVYWPTLRVVVECPSTELLGANLTISITQGEAY